jgi:hypothetical protein
MKRDWKMAMGGPDAKARRTKKADLQELRGQGDLEERRQGGEMPAVQWDRDQAVKSGFQSHAAVRAGLEQVP